MLGAIISFLGLHLCIVNDANSVKYTRKEMLFISALGGLDIVSRANKVNCIYTFSLMAIQCGDI